MWKSFKVAEQGKSKIRYFNQLKNDDGGLPTYSISLIMMG